MQQTIINIIRAILTGVLLFLVYRETGFWTAFALFLSALHAEISTWHLESLTKLVNGIIKVLR